MSLSLDATLNTAQESASRRPIVEIKSLPQGTDIPLAGQLLTDNTIDEKHPSAIAHSDGRLCLGFRYGAEAGAYLIKYYFTDTARNEWSYVDINIGTDDFSGLSLCELTNGNIGMVYLINDTGNTLYRLKYRIITKQGVAVSDGEIANWANTLTTGDPWVLTITTNSYIVVYTKFVAGDSHYHFYKRTSADFTSWAGEAEMAVGGLDDTKEKRNPSLILLASGDIWLWFDYVEATAGGDLTNIYYSISADNGGTWGVGNVVTSYTLKSEIANHAVSVQKVADEQYLLFTRKISALQMDDSETNWLSGDTPGNMCFDSVNRKLYVTNVYSGGGYKKFQCIVKIDIDTWTVDDCWDVSTAPAFSSDAFSATQHVWWHRDKGERYLIPIANRNIAPCRCIGLLNADADTITHYYFDTNTGWGVTKNVTWTSPSNNTEITHTQIDLTNNKLWVCMIDNHYTARRIFIGYLDLTEGAEPYTFTEVINELNTITEHEATGVGKSADGYFEVRPEDDLIILSGGFQNTIFDGFMRIWTLSTTALWKYYNHGLFSSFPYYGINRFVYYGGKIYGAMNYTSSYSQEDYRGIVEIDLSNDTFIYHRPSYASINDYDFYDFCLGEPNKIICAHFGYGIAIYNIGNDSWILHSNTNIPGLTSSGENDFWHCLYDDVNDLIFGGHGDSTGSAWQGVVMFSIHGSMRQTAYTVGTKSGASWNWSSIAALVQGYRDYEAVGWVDPGDSGSMYVFWTSENVDGTEHSIKWGKDGSTLDLTPYLTREDEISFERSIDGTPSRLEFTLAAGHLFDPYNKNSLFSPYVKKGRKITLRFGEIISSSEYWQKMGTVVVAEARLRYERGEYTNISVIAEDERIIWEKNHIYATEYYEAFPETIISDVLQTWAAIDSGDISISNFDNRVQIEHQWIETELFEVINQICDRFGYYIRFDVDHVAECKRIHYDNSVDHTYTAANKIISHEPDDRHSNFINKVTVMGQERSWTDVTFGEERVGELHGTTGWWGAKKDYRVYYSPDASRRCKNPRLNVLETANSIAFKMAGSISESISAQDTVTFKHCTVTVKAPNLIPALVGGLVALAATYDIGNVETGRMTISFGRILTNLSLSFVLSILCSIGNFQYEIYALPMGKIRRSIQASADDTEAQAETGCVIEKKLEDPLCYSQSDCAVVANHELMVVKYQRRRIRITKIAHLQDEDGDTIQIVHPHTGLSLKIFIVNLIRRYKKASGANTNDGYFYDHIIGWVVSEL